MHYTNVLETQTNSRHFPFRKNVRKFRLGAKWKTILWFVPLPGKFPVKVERLKRYPHFSGWNAPNGFSCSITTLLVFHASSRSTERNLPRSFWEKVASISVDQCTICFFSADSMKSLSNHECLSLGLGKYLVFEKIYSNAHLHFGCPQ